VPCRIGTGASSSAVRVSAKGWCSARSDWGTARPCASPWPATTPLRLDAGAPEYRTLRTGRTVYGGGGIRPDVLVGADTAGFSAYYANLIRRGVVNEYVISYMDRERAALEKAYPAFEAFDKGFEAGDAMLEGLTGLGGQRGVAFDEGGFAASAPLMRIQLKALVAQRLFDTAAFYRVMNPAQNEAYRRAVEILADWEHKGESLLAPED